MLDKYGKYSNGKVSYTQYGTYIHAAHKTTIKRAHKANVYMIDVMLFVMSIIVLILLVGKF